MRKGLLMPVVLGMMAAAWGGTVRIVNDTDGYAIYYVYISPASSDSWGKDRMGENEILEPGDSRAFSVQDGMYDIKLVDEDDDEYIRWDVNVEGDYVWNVTLDDLGESDMSDGGSIGGETVTGNTPVTIVNDTDGYDIYYIYANPSSYDNWGEDRLGSEFLDSGDEFTFYVRGEDYYDIMCEDEDGDTYTFWEEWVGKGGLKIHVTLDDMD